MSGFILEIDIRHRKLVGVEHNKAGIVVFIEGPHVALMSKDGGIVGLVKLEPGCTRRRKTEMLPWPARFCSGIC